MELRQKQLEHSYLDHFGNPEEGVWQEYIEKGAQVMRHDGTVDSARRILDKFLICSTPIYIQIQDEVLHGKGFSETTAGKSIMSDLKRKTKKLDEEFANLIAEMEDTLKNTKEDDKHSIRMEFEEEMLLIIEKKKKVLSERAKLCKADNPSLVATRLDNPSLIACVAEAGFFVLLIFVLAVVQKELKRLIPQQVTFATASITPF